MKIAVDARFASKSISDGQSAYLHNLLLHLTEIDPDNHYLLLTNELKKGRVAGLRSNYVFQKIPNLPHKIRRLLKLENIWWRGLVGTYLFSRVRPDITFSAINVGPTAYRKGSYIAVAHDLDYIEFPDLYTPSHREKNRSNTELALKEAKHVIAISESTKQQIIKYYDYDKNKITVIHHGYDEALFHNKYTADQISNIRKKYSLPERFVFSLGSLSPKKNIPALLQAIASLKITKCTEIHCILAGGFTSTVRSELRQKTEALGIKENVQFIGYAPNEDLPIIYNAATLFVFPSIAEGFGLPLVEAMACGCPVITSNTSCMPEIVQDAAITCSPTDVQELAHVIDSLFNSNKKQKALNIKGLRRASFFNWEKTARSTLEVFHKVNSKKGVKSW